MLGSQGNGYMSWVIKGLEWVCEAHKQADDGKCVVNLSLSGGTATSTSFWGGVGGQFHRHVVGHALIGIHACQMLIGALAMPD